MPPVPASPSARSLSLSPEQQWQHHLAIWQTSSNWRQQWAALKKLSQLDREYFPGQFLPIACELLSRPLPHNICWLKTLSEYGLKGVTSSGQATTLWSAWEQSCQRLFLRKWTDDNQLACHLRALSGIDHRWFPGRLRPFLFQILEESHLPEKPVMYDWRVFRAIQHYMRHDVNTPPVWHQWHEQWQKLFRQSSPDTRFSFFALESLFYLDEFHLPGIARPLLCEWLHGFSHTTLPPWQLARAMRRYTLKVAREGHDDLAYAWKSYLDRDSSPNPLASQVLQRLRSRVQPQTWMAICATLNKPSPVSVDSASRNKNSVPPALVRVDR